MRIGLFTYGMGEKLTGIGNYTYHLSYALQRNFPQWEIFLLNPYPSSPLTWYQDFSVIPVPSLKRLPSVLLWGPSLLDWMATRHQLDILHDPTGIAPFLGRPRTHYGRIVTIHDAIPYIYPRHFPLLTHVVFGTYVRNAHKSADWVLTDSQSALDDLVRYANVAPHMASYIYPGSTEYDLDWLNKQASSVTSMLEGLVGGQPYFLYVGALNPRKNVPTILHAIGCLQKDYPGTRLVVVGPPTWGAKLVLELIRQNSEIIHWLGFVPQDVLHGLYRHAKAVLVPSLYEGFGLPALEGMAHGCPVIASTASSLPEVVGDSALMVEPTDVAGWTQAMAQLLSSPSTADQFASLGRRRATQFSWDKMAQEIGKVYQRVAQTKQGVGE